MSAGDRSVVAGPTQAPAARVVRITSARSASSISRSWVVIPRRAGSMPSPVEALPCGSRSTSRTLSPSSASAAERLIAVVVLPTPPFWLATAMIRGPGGRVGSDTGDTSDDQDNAARVGSAALLLIGESPMFKRMGDLVIHGRALRKDRHAGWQQVPFGIGQEWVEGRQGPGGQDLGAKRCNRLDALRDDRYPEIERPGSRHQECGLALIALDERHRQLRAFGRREDCDDQAREASATSEVNPVSSALGGEVKDLRGVRKVACPYSIQGTKRHKVYGPCP